MKNEFVLAFNEVLEEKQLPKEIILEALEAAMVSAYRRAVNASNAQHVEARVDLETGDVVIYAEKEIVDSVQDDRTEVAIDVAKNVEKDAKIGGIAIVESTPTNFGRVAAQTARQVIQQRIREAERDAQLNHYSKQLGEIVSGVIQAINSQAVTLGLDMKAEGVMPRNHQIPGEKYRVHERIRALLLEVKPTSRGPQIVLSRAHRNFLRRLLENEVPEIYHGLVEIRSIAREPGQRSKVAVSALQTGVDPVGACVGLRGVRIQAIVKELNDEKIDVIEWNPDPVAYIAKSLSPARVTGVYLNEHAKGTKTATVVVPEDQLSLAIGRDGQNARLAARLTSWRIDIKSLPEAATDSLYKLQNDPDYANFAEREAEIVPQIEIILAKKSEGRPVTPEEYQTLGQFVDRIEKGIIQLLEKDSKVEQERMRIAEAEIPKAAYDMPLEDIGIPLRYSTMLSGAGYISVGDLMLQMKLDSNVILGLSGIGAKAFQVIEEALANISFPEEQVAETVEEEAPAEVEEATEAPTAEVMETAKASEETPAAVADETVITEAGIAAEATPEAVEVEPVAKEAVEAGEQEAVTEPEAVSEEEPAAVAEVLPVTEEDEDVNIEDIFKWRPEVMEFTGEIDSDEDDDQDDKKKKKKKKKYVEYEFDPDKEIDIVKKKRKRGGEWEDDWSI
jgi:N utilization substance protein A